MECATKQLAALYASSLKDADIQLPTTSAGNNNTWHQFGILDRRDALQAHLKERGVDSMIYYPVPLHFHEPYKKYASWRRSYPLPSASAGRGPLSADSPSSER